MAIFSPKRSFFAKEVQPFLPRFGWHSKQWSGCDQRRYHAPDTHRKKTIILKSRFYQSLDGPGLIPEDCQSPDDIITSIALVITLTWVVLPKPARPVRQQHIGWDYVSQKRCYPSGTHTSVWQPCKKNPSTNNIAPTGCISPFWDLAVQ